MKRAFIGETPSCHWGSADSFFERLSSVKEDLPIYRGELFLEYHRALSNIYIAEDRTMWEQTLFSGSKHSFDHGKVVM